MRVKILIGDAGQLLLFAPESNSEYHNVVDEGSRGIGVNLISARGTTQTKVKVPEYLLSASEVVCNHRQKEGGLRSSHPIISV